MVVFTTRSGVAMPGALLGDGIDQSIQQVQLLSFQEMKIPVDVWCMVPDLAVVHP